jgi:hypothetical protein
MHPLQTYLSELHDIRSTGAAVKETSYYPPLANLLNAVGATLKPRVRCVMSLKNQGPACPTADCSRRSSFRRGPSCR